MCALNFVNTLYPYDSKKKSNSVARASCADTFIIGIITHFLFSFLTFSCFGSVVKFTWKLFFNCYVYFEISRLATLLCISVVRRERTINNAASCWKFTQALASLARLPRRRWWRRPHAPSSSNWRCRTPSSSVERWYHSYRYPLQLIKAIRIALREWNIPRIELIALRLIKHCALCMLNIHIDYYLNNYPKDRLFSTSVQ